MLSKNHQILMQKAELKIYQSWLLSAKQFSSMNDSLIDFISEMSLTSDADDENIEML